jgi:hypothetical protein
LLGWVATVVAAWALAAVLPRYFALTPPWRGLVALAGFGLPVLVYSCIDAWLQPGKRGWVILDEALRPLSPELRSLRTRTILWQTCRLTIIVTVLSMVTWPTFLLVVDSDPVRGSSVRAALREGLQISGAFALVTLIFGGLLYASKFRIQNRPAADDKPSEDA